MACVLLLCVPRRTVSYAPPAYYAHHTAYRARCLLRKQDEDRLGATTATSSTSATTNSTWTMAPIHPNLLSEWRGRWRPGVPLQAREPHGCCQGVQTVWESQVLLADAS
jgi:hypothetical protein